MHGFNIRWMRMIGSQRTIALAVIRRPRRAVESEAKRGARSTHGNSWGLVTHTHLRANGEPLKIAIVGAGISGMSAAWLLSQRHNVTVYESEPRLGGHSHTVDAPTAAGAIPVDMGFIVYNELNYPNLVALFEHLGVPTKPSNMGFSVSLDNGRIEYGGDSLPALFAQWRNLVSPRFWSMLADLVRFYRQAPQHACALDAGMTTLGDYLTAQGYGRAFQDDHLLPQAAAIWSASVKDIRAYPAAAFIRFCENHGLLKILNRPLWRTVDGGSRAYVSRLTASYADRVRLGVGVVGVSRTAAGALVKTVIPSVMIMSWWRPTPTRAWRFSRTRRPRSEAC